jgi:hypothetical protein
MITRFFSSPFRSAVFALALCLVISLLSHFTDPFVMDRRVLRFKRVYDGALIAELHALPRTEGLAASVSAFIDEYLLGPISIDLNRSFNRNTRKTLLSFTEKAVYLELSDDALEEDPVAISPQEGISLLKDSVSSNFPGIAPLSVSIAGYPYESALKVLHLAEEASSESE